LRERLREDNGANRGKEKKGKKRGGGEEGILPIFLPPAGKRLKGEGGRKGKKKGAVVF